MEDQVGAKRCGHRPNKEIVPTAEMCDRIKAAVDGRTDASFVIMARTDALANEGFDLSLERIQKYVEAGADMVFPEAVTELGMYRKIADAVKVPVLANITEFGKTPLYTLDDVTTTLPLFDPVAYGTPVPIGDGITAEFLDAGHILGSSSVLVAFGTGAALALVATDAAVRRLAILDVVIPGAWWWGSNVSVTSPRDRRHLP